MPATSCDFFPDHLPERICPRKANILLWHPDQICSDVTNAGSIPEAIASFITRWEKSGGSEKANYALFLTELCGQILHVPHPEPASPDNASNRYVFERAVTHLEPDGYSATGYLDLYRAGASPSCSRPSGKTWARPWN